MGATEFERGAEAFFAIPRPGDGRIAPRRRVLFLEDEPERGWADALQVLAHITIGNNRLKIVPVGKFAIAMNLPSEGATADALRVYVDLEKLKKYPTIDTWYANSPAFDKKTMKGQLFDEIFRAGRNILSFERVRVTVKQKEKWSSVTCPCCGEMIPDYLMEGDHCAACGSMRYYEKI